MKNYSDRERDSGIQTYEYGEDWIVICFKDNDKYKYTNSSAGSSKISKMKLLADRGNGLNSFITLNKPRFSQKIR